MAENYPPSLMKDPLAKEIDWSPLELGGTDFQNRKLIRIGPSRLNVIATTAAKLSYYYLLLFSVIYSVVIIMADGPGFALLVGAGIAVLGGGALYFESLPIIFDKNTNQFSTSHTGYSFSNQKPLNSCGLDEIHALQILSKSIRADMGSSFTCYELNLILKTGDRINILDHAEKEKLMLETDELSRFLNVPIWDASEED